MNIRTILGSAAVLMLSLSAHANGKLSDTCTAKLKSQMEAKENAYLQENFGQSVRNPEIQIWLNTNTKGVMSVRGWVTDTQDGRSAVWGKKGVSLEQVNACSIELEREEGSECRYSSEGEDELLDRSGATIVREATLKPTTKLSKIEAKQIESFLQFEGEEQTVSELIAGTDDGEVIKKILAFPNGKRLEYYKAYGGDNPHGAFFLEKTTTVAGSNSDDSICINYEVEK